MRCARCQEEAPADAAFCPECGAKLNVVCAECGTANAPGHKFCKQCGRRLGTASAVASAETRFASPESDTPKHLAEKILTSRSALQGEREPVTVLLRSRWLHGAGPSGIHRPEAVRVEVRVTEVPR